MALTHMCVKCHTWSVEKRKVEKKARGIMMAREIERARV
jgi:hypothetical protein